MGRFIRHLTLNSYYIAFLSFIALSISLDCNKTHLNEYDYVVVGGGTAGLAVASRISEDPNLTVLVLEAGQNGHGNPGISIPGFAGSTFRSGVDWNYTTVPLNEAGGRSIIYPRGKVLGGSSALNFMIATKASSHDYDTLKSLGNPGWGWSEFNQASQKSERFLPPPKSFNFTFDLKYHGLKGLVKTSFPKYLPPNVQEYLRAAKELGHLEKLDDCFEGELQGPYYFPSTIDEKVERMTSAKAYYFPIASRPNLVVQLDSEVDRLLTSKSDKEEVIIQAVEYTSRGVKKRSMARKEIILSAGSFGTPAILERSGMGNPSILSQFGIPLVLNLPGVGSNLADHAAIFNTYQLKEGLISGDNLQTDPTYAASQLKLYHEHRDGVLTTINPLLDFEPLSAFLSKTEIDEGLRLLEINSSHLSKPILNAIKAQLLHGTPIEFIVANQGLSFLGATHPPNASLIAIGSTLQYPLSRGETHISSRDPAKPPLIDPGYFRHPFDLWLLSKASQHSRSIMNHSSWKSIIEKEFTPGEMIKSEEDWRSYIKLNSSSTYHAIGTSAMLPLELGGVVDNQLKVYGTQNLRIIDASIIPTQIAAHPSMTVYAIAEMAVKKIMR
ncbi:hypothetical protein DFH28DRAFT_1223301 [Melampsora americana]|nr:hypothetical protein DFH28DRAFT_1223301 [Melampsora americana]